MTAAPLLINPRLFAAQQAHFHGVVALQQLPRLTQVLTDLSGDLTYDLQFHQTDDQQILMTLTWQAQVHLICQRCLKVFQCQLHRTTQLQPVTDETELTMLVDDIEPVILQPDSHCFHLLELLTDEVILQIPAFAKHPAAECAVQLERDSSIDQAQECQKPFAHLAELLSKKPK
ncbi:MAG: hypothetical protein GKR77_03620 [Legionellales bacterium]|nr:hypothetical protein [Legionellales bacterium]